MKKRLLEMTVENILDAVKCELIRESQNAEISISNVVIAFDGLVAYDGNDYNKIIVTVNVLDDERTFELLYDKGKFKFNLINKK